eukprot:6030300-Prymnesium_polylepis.1
MGCSASTQQPGAAPTSRKLSRAAAHAHDSNAPANEADAQNGAAAGDGKGGPRRSGRTTQAVGDERMQAANNPKQVAQE